MRQLIALGEGWVSRSTNSSTARTRRTHLGLNALRRGDWSGGPFWLPWCLTQRINPLDCEQVYSALEYWGTELETRSQQRRPEISGNYALNLWNSVRSWHRWLSSPRGMGWGCDTGQLYEQLPRWQFLAPSPTRPKPLASTRELSALVRTADQVGANVEVRLRNGAAVALLVATGARVAEVGGMLREHLSLDGNPPQVRYQGKRGRWRTAPLPTWCARRVRAYLDLRDARRPGPLLGDEPVLAPAGLRTRWRTLSQPTLRNDVDAVVRRAGGTRITPHGIRASLITGALEQGESVWEVAGWTGHTSERSVRAYDLRRRGDAVAARLHAEIGSALDEPGQARIPARAGNRA